MSDVEWWIGCGCGREENSVGWILRSGMEIEVADREWRMWSGNYGGT